MYVINLNKLNTFNIKTTLFGLIIIISSNYEYPKDNFNINKKHPNYY